MIKLAVAFENAPAGFTGLKVRAAGMKGGHSGCDIHLQRANANRVIARALKAGAAAGPLHLAAIKGGNMRNCHPPRGRGLGCSCPRAGRPPSMPRCRPR